MKDKYFDKPQKFDAEDEAFFQKYFGQRNPDGTPVNPPVQRPAASSGNTPSQNAGRTTGSSRPAGAQSSANNVRPAGTSSAAAAAQQREAARRRAQQQAASRNGTPSSSRPATASSAARRPANPSGSVPRQAAGTRPSADPRRTSSATSAQRPSQQRRRVSPEEAQRIAAQQRRAQQQRAANGAAPSGTAPRPVSQSGQRQSYVRSGNTPPVPPSGSQVPKKVKRRKKRHHPILWILLLFVALVALVVGLGRQPIRETAGAGARTDGISTFVLAGTDAEGERTDTIMLVSINKNEHQISMMSIPRDTHVDAPYSVPKINSAVGYGGGGKRGMEELMTRISEITGFMPDGYILVDLNDFVSVVNFMGGVNFDVPMDMDYDDPTQDLKIHLKKGEQHLNGREAIQLVRFRSGYADADLGRTSVQRDFMQAALKQWTSPLKIWRIPFLTVMVATRIRTDMSLGNLGWIGRVGLLSHTHNIQMDLLPGEPQYIGSGSYYVADESATHSLMKQSYSPYR